METSLPRLPLPRSPNKPTLGAAVSLADSRMDPCLATDSSSPYQAQGIDLDIRDLHSSRLAGRPRTPGQRHAREYQAG